MTNRERARAFWEPRSDCYERHVGLVDDLAALLDEVARAEREACAKECESIEMRNLTETDLYRSTAVGAALCARRIRARNRHPDEGEGA